LDRENSSATDANEDARRALEPTNQAAGPDAAGRDPDPDPDPDPDRADEAPERTEEADADRGVEPPADADDGETSAGEASANVREGAVMRTGVGGAVSPGERRTSRMSSATSKREGRDDAEAGSRVLGLDAGCGRVFAAGVVRDALRDGAAGVGAGAGSSSAATARRSATQREASSGEVATRKMPRSSAWPRVSTCTQQRK
jgi:hypothetical protein